MTHDYIRNGITTLFAAFNVLDGAVLGRCMQRHRHQEFLRFLNTIEGAVPVGKVIHVILDNYGSHKHPKVIAWLARHPRWTFHFTPTSGSWLNAVETFSRRSPGAGSSAAASTRSSTSGRDPPLHRRAQRRPQALHLDQDHQPDPRQIESSEWIRISGSVDPAVVTAALRVLVRR
jgi:hypothetical protein